MDLISNFAAFLHMFIFLFFPFISVGIMIFMMLCCSWPWKLSAIAYVIYIYYERRRGHNAPDGNGWLPMRNNFIWRSFRRYFPIKLIKTAELPPNRNYVVAVFPHGILSIGVSTNIAMDVSEWLHLYPRVRPKDTILEISYCVPFFRELLRLWGWIPITEQSLLYHLRKSNDPLSPQNADGFTSNAVIIIVGGAQEALDSHPGRYCLRVRNRKGFVRVAIKSGASIVPSFSFGEVDAYDTWVQNSDSFLGRFQLFIKKLTSISPVFFKGRFGLLPHRKPIVQVVGAPIPVQQCLNPNEDYVNEVHQQVIKAVSDLFHTHKSKYLENYDQVELIIK